MLPAQELQTGLVHAIDGLRPGKALVDQLIDETRSGEALIEPGSLALGAHTLTTNVYYDGTFESVTGTFIVDAEGTGACP